MLWLHEGGFFSSSAQEFAAYDGTNLARRNVVVVSINHRINVFGFLNLHAYGEEFAESANVGLLDIVAALQWIRNNIGRFGGDSNNVTVFGQSGGGAKVNYLMAMPAAKGLFHKAISQSANPVATTVQTPDQSAAFANALLTTLGLDGTSVSKMRELPFEQIAAAATQVIRNDTERKFLIQPTVDGSIVPEAPFVTAAPSSSAQVPLMIGNTMRENGPTLRVPPNTPAMDAATVQRLAAEKYGPRANQVVTAFRAAYPNAEPMDLWSQMELPQFRLNTVAIAQRKARQGAAAAYVYLFSWQTRVFDGLPRAFHGSEVPFVFDNTDLAAPMTGGTDEARAVADRVCAAWVSFARTGNPNHAGLPNWTPVTETRVPTMILDSRCELKVDHDAAARQLVAG
jgi:para-nitrobenzyl esterase